MAQNNETPAEAKAGLEAVRSSIAHVTGIAPEQLSQDNGITWFDSMQANLLSQGWTLHKESAKVSIQGKHVGLFTAEGELQAAAFERDNLIFNPTAATPSASSLTQRLRIAPIKTPEDEEE